MGMYTRLQLDVELYAKYEDEVKEYVANIPRLRCTSYYFYDRGENYIEIDTHANAVYEPVEPYKIVAMRVLHVDISCKNYGQEIENFLEFLNGKVTTGGDNGVHVGSVRYENDNIPDLLFFEDDKIVRKTVTVNGIV